MAEFTCIVCPNSCRITVTQQEGGLAIEGNKCKRGEEFARNEFTCPMRMLTSTVKIEGARTPRIPVATTREVPKEKLGDCLAALYALQAQAPVSCGDVLIKDLCGTGADVIATRTMRRLG